MVMMFGVKESWMFIIWDEKVFLFTNFYHPMLCTMLTEKANSNIQIPCIQSKKGGKKLVEGVKTLESFRVESQL